MWNGLENLLLDNGIYGPAGVRLVTVNQKHYPEKGRGGVTVISQGSGGCVGRLRSVAKLATLIAGGAHEAGFAQRISDAGSEGSEGGAAGRDRAAGRAKGTGLFPGSGDGGHCRAGKGYPSGDSEGEPDRAVN